MDKTEQWVTSLKNKKGRKWSVSKKEMNDTVEYLLEDNIKKTKQINALITAVKALRNELNK